MARQRERVFSMSQFQTQAELDIEMEKKPHDYTNIFSQAFGNIYGDNNATRGKGDDDDVEHAYVEPARSNYPEDVGIVGSFGQVKREQKIDKDDPDEIKMEFDYWEQEIRLASTKHQREQT